MLKELILKKLVQSGFSVDEFGDRIVAYGKNIEDGYVVLKPEGSCYVVETATKNMRSKNKIEMLNKNLKTWCIKNEKQN